MKQYKNYELEDFLLDDHFRQWVQSGCPSKETVWWDIVNAYPEKRGDIDEAKAFIQQWQTNSTLTDAELAQEIRRVMASTEPVRNLPVISLNSRSIGWRVAAAVVLLVGIGWGIWQVQQPTEQPYSYSTLIDQSTLPLTEVRNSRQTPQSITLADGSRISLAPNSRVSYPTRFDQKATRDVFLTGEAFFEVAKNPKRPFLVYANGLVTRVVGTSFTIKAAAERVSVVVKTGRVAVYSMQGATATTTPPKLFLTPNQQANFLTEGHQLTRSIAENPVVVQAENTPEHKPVSFQFEETPIAEVFARLEKTYGLPILYNASVMKNCSLTVSLRTEPFFTKLDVICRTIGASYQVKDTQIIISSAGCD